MALDFQVLLPFQNVRPLYNFHHIRFLAAPDSLMLGFSLVSPSLDMVAVPEKAGGIIYNTRWI